MATPEIITAIKDLLLGLAAAVTGIVAVIGLTNWNRELKGKAQFDIAFNLAKATYKLRDEIRTCRVPLVSGQEFPAGYQISPKSNQDEAEAWAHVFRNRWQPVGEALRDFETHALAAEALWGAAVRSSTEQFRKCVGELNVGIGAIIDDEASGGDDFKSDKAFGTEMRRVVFSSGSKDNKLDQRIESAIQGIEEQIRPHLKQN